MIYRQAPYRVDAGDYARRIADSLRADGWPNTIPAAHAAYVAERYDVELDFDPGRAWRLADVAEVIAGEVSRRVAKDVSRD